MGGVVAVPAQAPYSVSDEALELRFTIKDVNAVKDELFAQCATNARAIANGLCAGAGCKLGEILSINYSWDEIDIHMGSCTCAAEADGCIAPDIDPDDIDVSDSVTFVWSIC